MFEEQILFLKSFIIDRDSLKEFLALEMRFLYYFYTTDLIIFYSCCYSLILRDYLCTVFYKYKSDLLFVDEFLIPLVVQGLWRLALNFISYSLNDIWFYFFFFRKSTKYFKHKINDVVSGNLREVSKRHHKVELFLTSKWGY